MFIFSLWFGAKDRDGPWLGTHNTRAGSAPSKTEKPSSKDNSAAASLIPETLCPPMDNTWPDSYDPPPKSKGKSVKLKKNLKTDNSKKLIRQSSKDSVVLVGYKNLKAPCGDTSMKYLEGDAPFHTEEQQDNAAVGPSGYSRTDANAVLDSGATSTLSGICAVDSVANVAAPPAACRKGSLKTSTNLTAQNNPQAGTGGSKSCNQPLQKDVDLSDWSAGLKQIEVKPSKKDPYQGEKVTVVVPRRADGTLPSHVPESAGATADLERPNKEAAAQSQTFPMSFQVKGDCIRMPDGAPSASSRFSDSGIESEPSSFAAQLFPGLQTFAGQGAADPGASQLERTPLSPAQRTLQLSSTQKPGGAAELPYPESTSAVSGVQSSLTSINSLPSDDDCEGSSKGSSRAGGQSRKSSILVQEQSLVFSGDAQQPLTEPEPKGTAVYDLGPEGASGSGSVKEPRSEGHTACPSSNSATSSTDLVKRGMVENYFGSCSSTDVSEISPLEASAITLGIPMEPREVAAAEDDEAEHEMIENGYYEEGDGYAFANGVAGEEQGGAGDVGPRGSELLFEQLSIGYLHETKDSSKAPICSGFASGSAGHSSARPPCPSNSPSFGLRWFECAPTAQMKA